eukprot:TRINITY_DN2352_c0_g1_i4.p1 TRINITY_DN2352_c0_g1~~TRINITY_DN2352_c0_g1_i4.p1  ORF type:complete len:346 (+),score=53.85 TRINITY_DN2352_c0_g1_i4:63-1040(+)
MGNKQSQSTPPSSALPSESAVRHKRGRVIKTCLVGPQKTGKSSYLSRLEHKPVSATYDQTIGVEFGLIIRDIGGEPVKIQVWDTAGAPLFQSITRTYYRGCIAAVLFVDLSDASSLTQLQQYWQEMLPYIPTTATYTATSTASDTGSDTTSRNSGSSGYPVVVCCTHIAADKANAVMTVQDVAVWMREVGIAHSEQWMPNRTVMTMRCYADAAVTIGGTAGTVTGTGIGQQGAAEKANIVSYGETASAAAVDWKQQFCTELDRHNVRNLFEVDCVQRPESVEESFAALLTMIEHLTDAYTEDFTAPGVRMHHPTSGKHLDALFMA